ncbi:MAG TPA: uracil-DNA glycosylase [Daejeonella sp.]|nr:uracil-DNA glycosylase [Daejeonella sp.]
MLGQLEQSWQEVLEDEFRKNYMIELIDLLQKEQSKGQIIYPPANLVFNAFQHTPFFKVKVVILGQDPYHGAGQAHGLSFSVQKGISLPPSLKNIFKELSNDIPSFHYPSHGDLSSWADQGILLLNTVLTVEASKAGSHQKRGWEKFTDRAIAELSARRQGIIFLLWGKHAQEKASLIDSHKHYILEAAHPSPFSAHRGFLGCHHFSKTNKILIENGQSPINWQIP